MSTPSVWWPLPVPASRWFSEDERRESRRYHDPIQRAAVIRLVAQTFGVLAAWWMVRRGGVDVAWWLVVGAVLVAATVPRVATDAWHEFVHEPRFGGTPVNPAAFAVTSVGRLVVEGGILAIALELIRRVDNMSSAILGCACVGAAIPLLSGLIGPRLVLITHRATDVPADHEAHEHVTALATAHNIAVPRLVELDRSSFEGANAYVTGQGSSLTVAVSHRLLNGPDALLRHVVGHEMNHLRRRHLLWSALASSISVGATIGWALAITTRLVDGDERLPVLVLVAVAVSQPFRLGLAWLSRANERQADRSALRYAPVSPELIRQLHLSDRPLLEPSRFARWQSSHPTPAERLEAARRSTEGASTF